MRSSSTSSAMRLSRSANTLYAIVPRWLRWPGEFRAGPAGVDGPVVRKSGCAGKLRWQEVARGLGAGGLRWQEWRQGPVPLFGRRWRGRPGPARCARRPVPILARRAGMPLLRQHASRLPGTAFAVASLTAKAALAGAGGPLRGLALARSPLRYAVPRQRCCSAIAMGRSILRHLYRLSPCWSFSVHSSGSCRLGHAHGDNAGLLLVPLDLP